jgi:hypothetical protein
MDAFLADYLPRPNRGLAVSITKAALADLVCEYTNYGPMTALWFINQSIDLGHTIPQFMDELSLTGDPEREYFIEELYDLGLPYISSDGYGSSLASFVSYPLHTNKERATITVAPIGFGAPPSNAVPAVFVKPSEEVRWQLDQNGWAIGYQIQKLGASTR